MDNELTYEEVAEHLDGAGWLLLSKEERQQVLRDLEDRQP